jgi:hypothetical protein
MIDPRISGASRIDSDFWAITSYFNPMRYRSRLANFRTFRKHLQVPLIAVELTYIADFELRADDAEILVQLRGGAVLWQKERLLNIALQALPLNCRKVAWLDCDIIFAAPDWHEAAAFLLDRFALIQLFRRVHGVGPQWTLEEDPVAQVEYTQESATTSFASGVPAATSLGLILDNRRGTSAPGHGWASWRELVNRHSFYDACIVGGGDRAMICAANGCFDEVMRIHCMNEQQRQWYMNWAKPFHETVRAETTFLDADIFHLWHGDISMRKGRARHEGFQRFRFDPCTDIALGNSGAWRWNTDKAEMHKYVHECFASRREDG